MMVVRHAQAPYTKFVQLFHMAVFFMASGYLYSTKNAKDLKAVWKYYLKKLKGIYLPYIAFVVIFILLRNVFIDINIYTDNPLFLETEGLISQYVTLTEKYTLQETVVKILKTFVFRGDGQQMSGALWFLQTLFLVLVGYNIVEFVCEKISKKYAVVIQSAGAVVALLIGYWCMLTGEQLGGFNKVCSVYILVHFGVLMKRYGIMEHLKKVWQYVCGFVIGLVIILIGMNFGSIGINTNNINNPVFFVLMSCSGWLMLWSAARLMLHFHLPVNRGIEYISRYSMWILGLHFLCFKLVNYLVVLVYGMDWYMVAGFPVNIMTGAWWLLYTIVGITVPLLIRIPITKVKTVIQQGITKNVFIKPEGK